MQDIPFDQLLEATRILQPQQRQALAQMLQLASSTPPTTSDDDSLAESEALNEAGSFSVFTTLPNFHLHATPIVEAELIAAAQSISCEWEEEPI